MDIPVMPEPNSGPDAGSANAASIRLVGIIGAGQMGNGIAHVASLANYDVLLNDLSSEAYDKAMKTISRNMDRQVSREAIVGYARHRQLRWIEDPSNTDTRYDRNLLRLRFLKRIGFRLVEDLEKS